MSNEKLLTIFFLYLYYYMAGVIVVTNHHSHDSIPTEVYSAVLWCEKQCNKLTQVLCVMVLLAGNDCPGHARRLTAFLLLHEFVNELRPLDCFQAVRS